MNDKRDEPKPTIRRAKFEVTYYITSDGAPFFNGFKVSNIVLYRTQGRSSVLLNGKQGGQPRSARIDFRVDAMPEWLVDLIKENLTGVEMLWLSGWHPSDKLPAKRRGI